MIFASSISLHCKRNIVINSVNSLVAYARHSSTLDAFTTAAARLVGSLHSSYGYPLAVIRAALRLFYHWHSVPFLHLPPWGPRLLRTLLTRYHTALPPPPPHPTIRPPSLIAVVHVIPGSDSVRRNSTAAVSGDSSLAYSWGGWVGELPSSLSLVRVVRGSGGARVGRFLIVGWAGSG